MPAGLQSKNSTLTTSLLVGKNNVMWILFGLFLMVGWEVSGQNGVTITSPEEPGPTSVNPIPIEIKFDEAVNFIDNSAFQVTNGNLTNLRRVDPEFSYRGSKGDLNNFTIDKTLQEILDDIGGIFNLGNLGPYLEEQLSEAVISIDFNRNDKLFYLTYGNGLYQLGNPDPVIAASHFETPLDFVINRSNGNIYVADHGKKQILIFNESYVRIGQIGTGTDAESKDPRGTSGLALDIEGNIYNADNYTGNTSGNLDAIKIYSPDGEWIYTIDNFNGDPIQDPLRIAVDIDGNIFLSDSGGNNGRVLIYDKNYNPITIINQEVQGSPGSLVTDIYGYLYVADFADDFDLNALFNDPLDLLNSFSGIENGNFNVKVYDPRDNYNLVGSFPSENVDLPIDLAINSCGRIYVNNMDLTINSLDIGKIGPYPIPNDVDVDFNFSLKEFKRQDNFTADIFPEEEGLVEVNIDKPLFQCEPQPDGDFSIVYQPQGEPSFSCPEEGAIAGLPLDAICDYEVPDYRELVTDFKDFENTPALEQTTSREGDMLSVSIVVRDGEEGELVGECSFEVELTDGIKPEINCPTSTVTISRNSQGNYVLPDYGYLAVDNCDNNLTIAQNPSPGVITSDTSVTLTATDESGNVSTTCSFMILVSNPPPSPTFDCDAPANLILDLNENCNFEPIDYSRYIANVQNFTDEPFIVPTETRNGYNLVVNFKVYDGEGGTFVKECSFSATLRDTIAPKITSCNSSDVEIVLKEGETFSIPDYKSRLVATDNCDSSPDLVQNPPIGTSINQTTTVSIIAKDDVENVSTTCSFTIFVSTPPPSPTFDCDAPANLILDLDQNCNFEPIDYSRYITNIQHFTDEPFIVPSESRNGSNLEVNFKVYDGEEGAFIKECSFTATLIDNIAPEITSCNSTDFNVVLEEGETYNLVDYRSRMVASDNCDTNIELIQTPQIGTSITQNTTVSIMAKDDAGNESEVCQFKVVVERSSSENLPPIANNDEYETYRNETLTVSAPDGVLKNDTDPENNSLTAILVRDVSVGTLSLQPDGSFVYFPENMFTGVASFSYVANDGENNSTETIVSIIVLPPENNIPVAADDYYITPQDVTLYVSEEDGVLINDYDADGEELEAIISVEPTNGSVALFPDGSFTYIPNPGYVGNDFFTYTIEDRYGFFAEAVVNIKIENESAPPPDVEITCAEDQTRSLDKNCGYVLPNFKDFATATEGATITQSPAEGMMISETQTIRLTATLDGATDFCEFELNLIDTTPPQITCPPNQIENYDPSIGFEVPDYTGMVGESDNCGMVEVTQSPPAGTIIYESEDITLTAKDQTENSVPCMFTLSLTEEEVLEITCIPDQTETLDGNCQFVIPNYTDQASVNYPNAIITQSPEPGLIVTSDTSIILAASLNGETDICEFKILLEEDLEAPIANCILTGIFELGPNGTLTLPAEQIENNSTDNCGIAGFTIDKTEFTTADIGENVITLTVTDTAGNMDTCQTTITIVPNENTGSDFNCVPQIILELDSSGNAALNATDLYTGDPGNRSFTISRENFNCTNTGTNIVTLSYTGSTGSGSCEINVEVVDNINPVLITNNINVSLNAQGQATISPQLINNGSYDNCGEMTFSLNKNTFSCKDIGENVISLSGEDGSGNVSTVTATVTVTGNCNGIPDDPVDYIYIYPNPTTGPFTFAVPQGWIIEKAEVFDSRGRYLITQIFEERASYSMDLTGFQDAVYILLLYTNEGKKIVRVIIH